MISISIVRSLQESCLTFRLSSWPFFFINKTLNQRVGWCRKLILDKNHDIDKVVMLFAFFFLAFCRNILFASLSHSVRLSVWLHVYSSLEPQCTTSIYKFYTSLQLLQAASKPEHKFHQLISLKRIQRETKRNQDSFPDMKSLNKRLVTKNKLFRWVIPWAKLSIAKV